MAGNKRVGIEALALPVPGRSAPYLEKRGFQMSKKFGSAVMSFLALLLFSGVAIGWDDNGEDAHSLRRFISEQVGGLGKLTVPVKDADIPLPRGSDGTVNPRYKTTEQKRYLGKLLFHDPIRTARIDPAYGGLLATAQTGSCGSCHLGEAAGKAGAVLNFNVGGEGRGYTDENGNYIIRRRPRSDLPILRQTPLFEGDALVDALPTLTDIYHIPVPLPGHIEIATPARGEKQPLPDKLLATGRLDALDSVGRQSPSTIGFAFNNRLLLGGFAGEPDSARGGLNPFNDPAQENLTLLLLDAHRMLTAESAELQKYPAFVKLFQDAFPEEAAQASAKNDMSILINDQTVLRATATFLRTAVTRNTPWDKFLAGDNQALTSAQRRGAKLFFTPATEGGAGCFSCHSGPMLNKQHNDPDVAGVGQFVEENFYNVGIGDHPLQALGRLVRNDPNFHDEGRKEITFKDEDAFKFRVITLRQLKDARTFFTMGHSQKCATWSSTSIPVRRRMPSLVVPVHCRPGSLTPAARVCRPDWFLAGGRLMTSRTSSRMGYTILRLSTTIPTQQRKPFSRMNMTSPIRSTVRTWQLWAQLMDG